MFKPFGSGSPDTRNHFSRPDRKKRIEKQEFRCVGYKRKCGKKLFVTWLRNKNKYSLDRGAEIAEFDHKSSNNANNSFSNCQALCPACHRRKSSADQGSNKIKGKIRKGQKSSKAKKLISKAQRNKEVDKYSKSFQF